jgi:thiol-disulfide isomerase/thioredoxin
MKKILLFVTIFTVSVAGFTQVPYEVISERPNEKTYKGIISRDLLEKDTSFKWYAENKKGYTPNTDALEGLKKNKDSIHLVAFMGTWCSDSHVIIPKFYSLLDAAGFPQEKVTLIGVDRKKTTYSDITGALNVKNVPTIIIMKNGKEMGRVVEYGKFGLYDMELGSILKSMN